MRSTPLLIIATVFSLWGNCFLARASSNASQYWSSANRLMARGDSLLRAGHLDEARAAFKAALKTADNLVAARTGLGKIAIAEEQWADAADEFQKVLDREPDNFEAHYYRGICARETGKYKALLLRKLDWDRSNQHFQWVIGRDSLYKDVLYQTAVLRRYQKNYQEAIRLCHAQVRLRPELVEPAVKLFRFYRYFITHTSRPEAMDWLRQQSWEEARWAMAEQLRREGALSQADSILQDQLRKPLTMSYQPIYLSLTRINYAQNRQELAEKYYWQAVDEIQDDIDADLVFEEIKYIITDRELARYQSLRTTADRIGFFKTLWISRNPTPAAPIDYRLAEHYRRLLYAEQNFEFDGFRTWFNNPDKLGYLDFARTYYLNQEFDDKGLIYLRHGPSDDWAITLGEDIPSNESWIYYQTPTAPRMVFHFLLENTTGYWRFTPLITDPRMLEDRIQFGTVYYQLLNASEVERLTYETEMARESQESVNIGLSTDRHTWEKKIKPLEVPFSISTFRGTAGQTVLEISYAFSLAPLTAEIKNTNQNFEIEKGLSIHNLAWQEVEKYQEHLSLPAKKTETYVDLCRFEIPPDSYHVACYLRPLKTEFLGGWKYEIKAARYSSDVLSISDIQLATKIEPAVRPGKFVKNGLLVVPNPTRLYQLNQPVLIYFEIYHLSQDSTLKTTFAIEYKLSRLEPEKKGLRGLFGRGGKSSIATQIDREGKSELSVEYLAIDASQMKAGEYDLEVKIIDKQNGRTASQSRRIVLK